MRIKALLIWIEIKRKRENYVSNNIYDNDYIDASWQKWHSDRHMRDLSYEISELRGILKARDELKDVADLTC